MAKGFLPPGFRFHPTDVELVCYYLKRKVLGKPFRFEAISEIELYKFAPWDLPEKSCLPSKDLEWYFFCPGDRKYANGLRKNRSTDIGYWKTTGKDKPISHNSQTRAMRKTLVFHQGRPPKGDRTDWVMHEYRLVDKDLADAGILQDAYVLCKIHRKSGPGPKNGEQYGAPFKEEDWEDDKVNDSSALIPPTRDDSLALQHNLSDHALQSDTHAGASRACYSPEYFSIDGLLQELSENGNNDIPVVQENNGGEAIVANEVTISDGNGIYDGLEDLSMLVGLKSADAIYMEDNALQDTLLELSNQAEPNCFYDFHSSNNREEEHILHDTQFGTHDGSFLEMKDFQFPVGSQCSELVDPGNPFANSSCFQGFSAANVPALLDGMYNSSLGMEGPRGNTNAQHSAAVHALEVRQTTDEFGSTVSIQTSAGGEQHKPPSESLTTNRGSSVKLRYLLGSFAARPAIAAEYPSALKEEKLGGGISCYGSSIHVKAEVTLQCSCAEGSQLNVSDDFLFASSGKQLPSGKIVREDHASGGGFTIMFFLGAVSALMWIFLLTLGVKLGKSAWKLFLSSS